MEEWLDVVDHEDRIVGRDTRRRIHEQARMHRSSHIMLFNLDGLAFVQQRSLTKDEGGGLWDTSVAGHVDSGETYLQCAVRELQEEVGIGVDPKDLQWIDKLKPEARNGFEFTTVYCVCTKKVAVPNQDEIDDTRWLSANDLDNWIKESPAQFTDIFRVIWPLVRAHHYG